MNWTEILNTTFQVCIIPLLGTLTTFVILLIKNKTKELQEKTNNELLNRSLSILEETVINAVIATNQTYVEALKDKDAFDEMAQKEAFQKTYDAVINSLTEDTKKGLETITTNLSKYITELIEAKVNENK